MQFEQKRYYTNVTANLQRKTIPSIPRCISSPFPLLFGWQAVFEALSGSLLFHVRQMKAFNVGAKGSVWIITRAPSCERKLLHTATDVWHTHINRAAQTRHTCKQTDRPHTETCNHAETRKLIFVSASHICKHTSTQQRLVQRIYYHWRLNMSSILGGLTWRNTDCLSALGHGGHYGCVA